jgi:hypothetical protein
MLVDITANILGEAAQQLALYADRSQATVYDMFDAQLDFPASSFGEGR